MVYPQKSGVRRKEMVGLTQVFLPEGRLLNTEENTALCAREQGLLRAMEEGRVLEGQVLNCTAEHDLTVAVGPFTGRIPRTQAALGIAEGTTKEIAILSRVGKPVCFTVESVVREGDVLLPILSRARAQRMALNHLLDTLEPGVILPATVTHLEPFGAFVDIGCGVVSMVGIENISVSRIPHSAERFAVGQEIFVLVTGVDRRLERVFLSHKELLGTWEENAAAFRPGMTVPGFVRGVKDYGVFIELTPNLSGLAEFRGDLREGDRVSVYIKSILSERRKIKLHVLEKLPGAGSPPPLRYFHTAGSLGPWRYAVPTPSRP